MDFEDCVMSSVNGGRKQKEWMMENLPINSRPSSGALKDIEEKENKKRAKVR
jgi:hypothetical protein